MCMCIVSNYVFNIRVVTKNNPHQLTYECKCVKFHLNPSVQTMANDDSSDQIKLQSLHKYEKTILFTSIH